MKGIAPIVLVLIALGVITATTGTSIAIAHSRFPADSPLWGIHVATKRLICNFASNVTDKVQCHQNLAEEISEQMSQMEIKGRQDIAQNLREEHSRQEQIIENIKSKSG
jgi:hypothetical protein